MLFNILKQTSGTEEEDKPDQEVVDPAGILKEKDASKFLYLTAKDVNSLKTKLNQSVR